MKKLKEERVPREKSQTCDNEFHGQSFPCDTR